MVLVSIALLVALFLMLVFAQITGWRSLSRAFPAPPAPRAPSLRSPGVILGAWGWNAPPLRVGLDEAGVRLSPRRPFDLAFREVEVPWEAIESVTERHLLLFDVVEIRYGAGPQASLGFLSGPAAEAVAATAVSRGAALLTPSG